MKLKCSEIWFDQTENVSREPFTLESVQELAATIAQDGLIHPVKVRPIEHPQYKYKLFVGFRRFAAVHMILGWEEIKAEVEEDISDENARIQNCVENIHREDITFWEECKAVKAAFPDRNTQTTEIAKRFGKTRGWVRPRWYLWSMPQEVIDQVQDGILNQAQMQIIIQHKTKEEQIAAAEIIRDASRRGVPTRTIQHKLSNRKAFRSQKQMRRVMTIMMEQGKDEHMHIMRWCAGDISDEQLSEYLGYKIESEEGDILDYNPNRQLSTGNY